MQTKQQTIPDAEFVSLAKDLLGEGLGIRFRAGGRSMMPFIRDGDVLTAVPAADRELRRGDVVVYADAVGKLVAHRIIGREPGSAEPVYRLQGDAHVDASDRVPAERILGLVVEQRRDRRIVNPGSVRRRAMALLWHACHPALRRLRFTI